MKPIRHGMIGGGLGAFIGGIHHTPAAIAGNWQLTAGAFSSTPDKSLASGAAIGLDPDRTYGSWEEILARETALFADVRIEAFGRGILELAAATRVWRGFFASTEEVCSGGHAFIRSCLKECS